MKKHEWKKEECECIEYTQNNAQLLKKKYKFASCLPTRSNMLTTT